MAPHSTNGHRRGRAGSDRHACVDEFLSNAGLSRAPGLGTSPGLEAADVTEADNIVADYRNGL